MNSHTNACILSHFADLDDSRDEQGKDHRLLDIVAIAICAVMCGGDSEKKPPIMTIAIDEMLILS